jgi:hypothetical protein
LAIGPAPSAKEDPRARVHVAIAGPQRSDAAAMRFAGHPDIVLQLTGKQALNLLRKRFLLRPT